jgi:hypothetical protein
MNATLSKISLEPYRVEESTAHFEVSEADFGDFVVQIKDAISFLKSHMEDVKLMMGEPNTSGVLDFAIEWRDVAVQNDNFPAELVREAGSLGLALELSHYPISEEGDAQA